jgi:hypothetical protein
MTRLAAGKSASFQEVCRYLIESERPPSMAGWRILFPSHAGRRAAGKGAQLKALLSRVGSEEQVPLTQLLVLAREMRELHDRLIQRQRYINIMAVWLHLHVPLSFAMVVAVVVHITAFFYYW